MKLNKEKYKMNTTQLKAMLASYLRSVLGAAIALYLSGVTDPAKLALALVAALVPVATRALNPKDRAFGILPSVDVVDAALATAKTADTQPVVDGITEIEKLLKEIKKTPAKKPTTPKK
jgi:hypothetical protein